MVPYLVAVAPAFAAWPPTDPFAGKTLCGVIGNVVDALFILAVAIAVVMLLIGGYQYMSSGGDKMAVADARGRITGAVVGLVIALAAYLLIYFIVNSLLQAVVPECTF